MWRMTRVLGRPDPLPYVEERDLFFLASDLGPGYFPSSDLYRWYVGLLEADGRKPVGRKMFGMALKEAGWQSSSRYLNGVMTRCWLITKSWVRRSRQEIGERSPVVRADPQACDEDSLNPPVWEGEDLVAR